MSKGIQAEVFLADLGHKDLCGPFFDAQGRLHVCYGNSGDVMRVSSSGAVSSFHCTQGQLSGGCFGPDGVMYAADFAHTAVLKTVGDGEQSLVVADYEDRPLKGPHSIVCGGSDVLFTDAGPTGETGLHNPTGSVFCIKGDLLLPVSLSNLAYPTGVAAFNGLVYVAEQAANRVLRFYQEPEGVYHGSVFYQGAGSVGPSCLAVDEQGSLYVGIFESCRAAPAGAGGRVLVLGADGKLQNTIAVDAPEVSGVAVDAATSTLYITERSNGSIYTVPL